MNTANKDQRKIERSDGTRIGNKDVMREYEEAEAFIRSHPVCQKCHDRPASIVTRSAIGKKAICKECKRNIDERRRKVANILRMLRK